MELGRERREVGLEKKEKRGVRREREDRDEEREAAVPVVVAIGEAREEKIRGIVCSEFSE